MEKENVWRKLHKEPLVKFAPTIFKGMKEQQTGVRLRQFALRLDE
jgi:hypothetical protein